MHSRPSDIPAASRNLAYNSASRIVVADELPETYSGKYMRRRLQLLLAGAPLRLKCHHKREIRVVALDRAPGAARARWRAKHGASGAEGGGEAVGVVPQWKQEADLEAAGGLKGGGEAAGGEEAEEEMSSDQLQDLKMVLGPLRELLLKKLRKHVVKELPTALEKVVELLDSSASISLRTLHTCQRTSAQHCAKFSSLKSTCPSRMATAESCGTRATTSTPCMGR